MRRRLLAWSEKHGRDFAWRHTRDLYKVLMAEMMVHRTKAAQAERVWVGFVGRFPCVGDTRTSSDAELAECLAPLGLNWRSRKLIETIRVIEASGSAPTDRLELERLPGVGHYAASAVRSICLDSGDPVVDANVVRVYSRLFGLEPSDSLRRMPAFHRLAAAILPRSQRARYNWALLDFGALVCRPAPICGTCPLSMRCVFYESKSVGQNGAVQVAGARLLGSDRHSSTKPAA